MNSPSKYAASPANELTTVTYRKRSLVMYPVQENELNMLCSTFNSIHFGLFGISLGAAISLGIAVFTVSIPEPIGTRFFVAFMISCVFTIYCGLLAARDWFRSDRLVRNIKTETVEVIVQQKNASAS